MVAVIFSACMVAKITIGFNCARHLGAFGLGLPIRLAVLAPCLAAFATLGAMTQDAYVPYTSDIYMALATISVYFVLSGVVAGKAWLKK